MNTLEPKLDIEFDNNWNGTLIIECPVCNTITKKHLAELSNGSVVNCTCGTSFPFSGDDLSGIQDSMDSLRKTLQSFS